VRAETPITEANWVDVTLAPGQSKSIEIGLSDGKEVSEHTTLVLAEASDDIVPAKTRSLTLRFMHDGRLAPVTHIDQIDVVTSEGDFRASIAEHSVSSAASSLRRTRGACSRCSRRSSTSPSSCK
jgi:hypothetical protein